MLLVSQASPAQRGRPVYDPPYVLEKGLSFHFSSPLGLLSKGGVMVEYRMGVMQSVFFGYTRYWGYFPGYQAYAGYRHYYETWRRHDPFFYVKAGIGNAGYEPAEWLNNGKEKYVAPGDYAFAGAGIGRHYNFGAGFIEFMLGVKYSAVPRPIDNYNERIFYVTGPGAIVEFNFNYGFQF